MSTSDRYQNLETKVLRDGRTVYKPTRPTTVRQRSTDAIIHANERDRFDIIAQNIYNSAYEWWRIAALNGHVDGSLHIKPGTEVRIPTE